MSASPDHASAEQKQCSGCGAVVELPAGLVAARCSYCDSPLVDATRASAAVDRVAPFRLVRSAAEQRLRAYLADKLFAPGAVRRLRVDARRLRGVLVPFWRYDGVVRSRYQARVGLHYHETETYRDASGKRRTRQVRKTEWFELSGTAARRVQDHLVSASTGLPEAESNALEPFDLGWARPFDPRWVAGFEAELPSVDRGDANRTAREELTQLERRRVERELLPGDENSVADIRSDVAIEGRELVLLPVWTSCFLHRGKPFRLLVNGQTGEVAGKVPLSAWKIGAVVVAGLAVLVGLVALHYFTVGGGA